MTLYNVNIFIVSKLFRLDATGCSRGHSAIFIIYIFICIYIIEIYKGTHSYSKQPFVKEDTKLILWID